MTPLHVITLVLDGFHFLQVQFSNFNRYPGPLVWHIVEGSAANTGSTAWCKLQQPRLSRDGTSELLTTWLDHPRIRIYRQQLWHGGKDEMFRAAMKNVPDGTVLLQADADEFFEPDQLVRLVRLFDENPDIGSARFFCRYYLGPNIVITSENGYGNKPGEWLRAWRYSIHMTLKSHEPPVMLGGDGKCASREQTRELGLVFDHWAWMFHASAAFKECFYRYKGAAAHWRRLQANTEWPINDLEKFLPWVGPGVVADKLFK